MSFYFKGARKRTLSSDTTESSDNEDEDSKKNSNAFRNNSRRPKYGADYVFKEPTVKDTRLG